MEQPLTSGALLEVTLGAPLGVAMVHAIAERFPV